MNDRLLLKLAWVAPVNLESGLLGGLALLDALRRLEEPFDLSFRLGSAGGVIHAGFCLTGLDRDSALAGAAELGTVLDACMPWYGFEVEPSPAASALAPRDVVWMSRVVRGDAPDSGIRAAAYSPLSHVLAGTDATVSAALVRFMGAERIELGADLVVASGDRPTTVAAAVLAAELHGASGPGIMHAHGSQAQALWESHGKGLGGHPVAAAALADLVCIPARMSGGSTAWQAVPARPVAPRRVMEALGESAGQHRLVIGATGTGKTVLLSHLVLADAEAGKAVLVIDPHGDLAPQVAAGLCSRRIADLVYLDFARSRPPTCNPMVAEAGQSRRQVVNEVCELVRGLWDEMPPEFFGPVFWRLLRWAVGVVQTYGLRKDLGEVARVLSGDLPWLQALVPPTDRQTWATWEREMSGTVGKASGEHALWASSKLDPFTSDAHLRRIFTGPRLGVSVTEAIECNQVVVVRAPVGKLGLAATRLIATTLVTRAAGALGRAFEDGTSSPKLALYVDEWQRVAQEPIERLMAEGRKQGLELTAANQSLRQLRDPAKVVATVGTLALLRTGPAEAAMLAAEFPGLREADLRRLPPHFVALRTPTTELVGPTPAPAPPLRRSPPASRTQSQQDRERGSSTPPERVHGGSRATRLVVGPVSTSPRSPLPGVL